MHLCKEIKFNKPCLVTLARLLLIQLQRIDCFAAIASLILTPEILLSRRNLNSKRNSGRERQGDISRGKKLRGNKITCLFASETHSCAMVCVTSFRLRQQRREYTILFVSLSARVPLLSLSRNASVPSF